MKLKSPLIYPTKSCFHAGKLLMVLLTSNLIIRCAPANENNRAPRRDTASLLGVATFVAENANRKDWLRAKYSDTYTDSERAELAKTPWETIMPMLRKIDAFTTNLAWLDKDSRLVVVRDVYQFADVHGTAESDGTPTIEESTPVVGFFKSMGEEGLPILVDVISDLRFTSLARRHAYSAIEHIKQLNARGLTPVFCGLLADEYAGRATLLRQLKNSLTGGKDTKEDAPPAIATPRTAEQKLKAWETSLTLISNSASEAQILTAIAHAQKLKSIESAPYLCDKLAPAKPAKPDSVVATEPKGRFSPAIAKASEAALRSMGHDALPALIDTVALIGHTPEYHQKVMSLIVAAAGSPSSAAAVLENAAKVNDERSTRLRSMEEAGLKLR